MRAWEAPVPQRSLCIEVDGRQFSASDTSFQDLLVHMAGMSEEDLEWSLTGSVDSKLAAQRAFSKRPVSAGAQAGGRAVQRSHSARSFKPLEARPSTARSPSSLAERSSVAASRAARSAAAARVAATHAAAAAGCVAAGCCGCGCGPGHDCLASTRSPCHRTWPHCCRAHLGCAAALRLRSGCVYGRWCHCGTCPWRVRCHRPACGHGCVCHLCLGHGAECGRCGCVGWNPHTGWCRCGFRNAPVLVCC